MTEQAEQSDHPFNQEDLDLLVKAVRLQGKEVNMKVSRFLQTLSKSALLGILLALVNVSATHAQTEQQLIAQYCNANDQGLIGWLQQNAPSMTPQQMGTALIQVATQLSPSCQALMNHIDQTKRVGGQTNDGSEEICNRKQQQAMIAWNGQAGPHRIRTDCWNFPR